MSTEKRPTFKRYGNDEEGHFFAPIEEPTYSSEGSTNWFGLFLCCAALFVLVFILRNSYSAEATTLGMAVPKVSIWETALIWVVSISAGVAGIVFIIYQSLVAYRDRANYWLLRLGRAGLSHAGSAIRLIASAFRLGWSVIKPGAKWTAQTIVAGVAWLLRTLRDLKGDYYFSSRDQVASSEVQTETATNFVGALHVQNESQNFADSEAGKLLRDMEEAERELAIKNEGRVNLARVVDFSNLSNN